MYSICYYCYPRTTFICAGGKIKTTFMGFKLFSYFSCHCVLKDHITRYGSFYIVCETNHYAPYHFRSYKKCTYFISPVAYYFFRIFVLSNKWTVKKMNNLCHWSGGKKPLVILLVFMHYLIIQHPKQSLSLSKCTRIFLHITMFLGSSICTPLD